MYFFSHLCTYLFYLAFEAKLLGLNPNSHSLNQLFQAVFSEGICNIKCILYLHLVSNFFLRMHVISSHIFQRYFFCMLTLLLVCL